MGDDGNGRTGRGAERPALVLIHGGGQSSACWDDVVARVALPCLAVDLPGRGRHPADLSTVRLADWVDSVVGDIAEHDLTDVVLVGHSMAGLTIPGVAAKIPDRIRRIVFVSCAVPPDGGSLMDTITPEARQIAEAKLQGRRGLTSVDWSIERYANDMTPDQIERLLFIQVPEARGVMTEPVSLVGLDGIPRTYVKLLRDRALTPDLQDRIIATIGGADVVELDAGHMAMISRPDELAAILTDVATR